MVKFTGNVGNTGLTLHLLLAKFFRIWALTDSWMFLLRAVSPAILKWRQRCFSRGFLGGRGVSDTGSQAAFLGKPCPVPSHRSAERMACHCPSRLLISMHSSCLNVHDPPPLHSKPGPTSVPCTPSRMGQHLHGGPLCPAPPSSPFHSHSCNIRVHKDNTT